MLPQPLWSSGQPADQQLGTSSFSLQLVQRTLEETLESVQKSIHEDVRNLHIELLRQFHMQEVLLAYNKSRLFLTYLFLHVFKLCIQVIGL